MEGYGVNTFKLINAQGKENLCKFHVMPKEGESTCSSPLYQLYLDQNDCGCVCCGAIIYVPHLQ